MKRRIIAIVNKTHLKSLESKSSIISEIPRIIYSKQRIIIPNPTAIKFERLTLHLSLENKPERLATLSKRIGLLSEHVEFYIHAYQLKHLINILRQLNEDQFSAIDLTQLTKVIKRNYIVNMADVNHIIFDLAESTKKRDHIIASCFLNQIKRNEYNFKPVWQFAIDKPKKSSSNILTTKPDIIKRKLPFSIAKSLIAIGSVFCFIFSIPLFFDRNKSLEDKNHLELSLTEPNKDDKKKKTSPSYPPEFNRAVKMLDSVFNQELPVNSTSKNQKSGFKMPVAIVAPSDKNTPIVSVKQGEMLAGTPGAYLPMSFQNSKALPSSYEYVLDLKPPWMYDGIGEIKLSAILKQHEYMLVFAVYNESDAFKANSHFIGKTRDYFSKLNPHAYAEIMLNIYNQEESLILPLLTLSTGLVKLDSIVFLDKDKKPVTIQHEIITDQAGMVFVNLMQPHEGFVKYRSHLLGEDND